MTDAYRSQRFSAVFSASLLLMMKHSIPPFSSSRISKMQVILTYHHQKKSYSSF